MSGAEIRWIRKKLNLTQVEFAQRLGVQYVTISRWENSINKPHPLGLLGLVKLKRQVIQAGLD